MVVSELLLKRLPALQGHWTYTRDRYGTVFNGSKVEFREVDGFIKQLYGQPKRAGMTSDDQQQWVIPARVAGVSVWYSKYGDGVRIAIVRPLKFSKSIHSLENGVTNEPNIK